MGGKGGYPKSLNSKLKIINNNHEMNTLKDIAKELLKSRIDFIEKMYSRFIQEESTLRTHPIDFKNFIIYELEKEINANLG